MTQKPKLGMLLCMMTLVTTLIIPEQAANASSSSQAQTSSISTTSVKTLIWKKFHSKSWLKKHGYLTVINRSAVPAAFECGLITCWEIRNRQQTKSVRRRIREATATALSGAITIGVNTTTTVNNRFSASVQVPINAVKAEVGFDVTRSWSTGVSASAVVPPGICKELRSYVKYNRFTGDLYSNAPFWSHWEYEGTIKYREFAGIAFKVFEVPCNA